MENTSTNVNYNNKMLFCLPFFTSEKLRTLKFLQKFQLFAVLLAICFSYQNANAQNCSVNAGVDRTVCPNSSNQLPIISSIALEGNQSAINVEPGTLQWSIVSQPAGASATIDSPNSLSSSVSGTIIEGDYTFQLTTDCTDNVTAIDQVTFMVVAEPTEAVVVSTDLGCYMGTPFEIEVSLPAAGETGYLYYQEGIPGTISQLDADTWTFVPEPLNSNCLGDNGWSTRFRYQIVNGASCQKTVYQTLNYNYASQTVYANAIPDFGCTDIELFGACPLDGAGEWTYTGPGVITYDSGSDAAQTYINASVPGDYTFTWTITGGCNPDVATVDVTFVDCSGVCPVETLADAGTSQNYCGNFPPSIVLDGSVPGTNQVGEWTQVHGPLITITDINDPNTSITGLTAGDSHYTFVWLVNGNGCFSRDTVSFTEIPSMAPDSYDPAGCISTTGYQPNDFRVFNNASYPLNAIATQDSICITLLIKEVPEEALNADGTFDERVITGISASPGGFLPSSYILPPGTITVGVPYRTCINLEEDFLDGETYEESIYYNASANFYVSLDVYSTQGYYDVVTSVETVCGTYVADDFQAYISTRSSFPLNAGTDIILDCNTPSTTLAGAGLEDWSGHYGQWTMVSGPGPSPLTETSQYESEPFIDNLNPGTYTFRYFNRNPVQECNPTYDDVEIVVIADNSPIITLTELEGGCAGHAVFAASYEYALGGTWSIINPAVTSETLTSSGGLGSDTLIIDNLVASTNYTIEFSANNACGSNSQTINLTTNSDAGPSLAQISEDLICTSSSTLSLNAANITNGIGIWSVISQPIGANASFSDINNPSTTINDVSENGTYIIEWAVSNIPCATISRDTVIIGRGVADLPNAGGDQEYCNVDSYPFMSNLAATPLVSPSTGQWIFIAGPDLLTFGDTTSSTSSFTVSMQGQYVIGWESSIAGCDTQTDYITIDIGAGAPVADAGPDQSDCGGNGIFTLDALDLAIGEVGNWFFAGSTGNLNATFDDINDPNTTLTLTGTGVATLLWTTQSNFAFCPANTDTILIDYFSALAGENGEDLDLCEASSTTLIGNDVTVIPGATNSWALVSGPNVPMIFDASSATTTVTGLVAGTYIFEYEVNNNAGCVDTDQITVNVASQPTIDAGADQILCGTETVTLTGNDLGADYTYEWVLSSGTDSGTFSASNSSTTTYGPLSSDGPYTFMYKITDGGCQNFDFVDVTLSANTAPTLTIDDVVCDANLTTYTIDFTSDGVVTSDVGTVSGNQVTDVPAGTDATLTADLDGCLVEQIVTSPTCELECPPTKCLKIILNKVE
ncbi:MAG: PKD domain-containing protein [Chitinophagales bacterium]